LVDTGQSIAYCRIIKYLFILFFYFQLKAFADSLNFHKELRSRLVFLFLPVFTMKILLILADYNGIYLLLILFKDLGISSLSDCNESIMILKYKK